jgi:hypothetical protein
LITTVAQPIRPGLPRVIQLPPTFALELEGADIPFISHLLAVAGIVIEAGGDEETVIAALVTRTGPQAAALR